MVAYICSNISHIKQNTSPIEHLYHTLGISINAQTIPSKSIQCNPRFRCVHLALYLLTWVHKSTFSYTRSNFNLKELHLVWNCFAIPLPSPSLYRNQSQLPDELSYISVVFLMYLCWCRSCIPAYIVQWLSEISVHLVIKAPILVWSFLRT